MFTLSDKTSSRQTSLGGKGQRLVSFLVYSESKAHNSKPLSNVYDQFQSCALLKNVKEKLRVR